MQPNSSGHDTLTDLLGVDQLPETELRELLASRFRSGQYTSGAVEYSTEQGPALTLQYRGPELVGITRGPHLTDNALRELVEAVEREQAATGRHIRRTILVANVPTVGHWRYKDKFQILPPPEAAPRPGQFVADHPFLLETSYERADDWQLDRLRGESQTRRVELLLALLLRHRVRGANPRYVHHQWTFLHDVRSNDLRSEFRQEGYLVPGLNAWTSEFDEPKGSQCEVVPSDKYYSERAVAVDSVLALPHILTDALDVFFSFSQGEQAKFLRSCYWFQTSRSLWRLSKSASYTALVQSVEVLIPSSQTQECPSCHRATGPGPTRRFSDFIDAYAPGTSTAERRQLYGLRSAISHGGTLLIDDEDLAVMGVHPQWWSERQQFEQMSRLAQVAIINRLLKG